MLNDQQMAWLGEGSDGSFSPLLPWPCSTGTLSTPRASPSSRGPSPSSGTGPSQKTRGKSHLPSSHAADKAQGDQGPSLNTPQVTLIFRGLTSSGGASDRCVTCVGFQVLAGGRGGGGGVRAPQGHPRHARARHGQLWVLTAGVDANDLVGLPVEVLASPSWLLCCGRSQARLATTARCP
jgi:hypothetical protein